MVLDFYYRIWVDGIVKMRSLPRNKGMWKFYGMVFMTLAMSFNLLLLMAILQRNVFKKKFWSIDAKIFNDNLLDAFTKFFILYALIPLLLNYFFIFWNSRYKTLLIKYPKTFNGKLFVAYTIGSLFLPFISIFVAYLCGVK